MAEVLGTDLLLLNRPNSQKTYKISVDELPIPSGGAAVYIGPNPPYAIDSDDENNGDLWWDTETGVLYIYYIESDDTDPNTFSKQWVQAAAAYGASKLGDLADINSGTAPEDTQALVWDADTSMWAPGVVGTSFIDLSGIDSTAFSLASSNRLPPTDNINTQDKANEWFVAAINDLEDRKLESTDIEIHPEADDVLLDGAAVSNGTGTSGDPIIIRKNTSTSPGGYELSSQKIKFVNQAPKSLVLFHDTNHNANGRRFDQDTGVIGDNGEFEIQLEYLDSPATAETLTYAGVLQVGGLYFKWEVEQSGIELNVITPTQVSGVPYVNATLHATPAVVSGGVALSHTIEWYTSDDQLTYSPTGYEGSTYTVKAADVDKYIRAQTIVVDSSGIEITSTSNDIGTISFDVVDSKDPIILGSSFIGSTLTIIQGSSSSSATVSHQWLRDGVDIENENNLFYELVDDDYNSTITAQEIIPDVAGGQAEIKESNAITARYAKPVMSQCAATGIPVPGSDLNIIGGIVVAGGSGQYTESIQWYRDLLSAPIPGATTVTYTSTNEDHQHSIFVIKSLTDDVTGDEVESTSNPVYVQYEKLDSSRPGIKGQLRVGAKLSAIPGAPSGGSGSYSIGYSWISNGVEVGQGKDYNVNQTDVTVGSIFVRETVEDSNVPDNTVSFDSLPLEDTSDVFSLDQLTDVDVADANNGDILMKSGNMWIPRDPVALPELIQFLGFVDVNTEGPPTTFTKDGTTFNGIPVGSAFIQHKLNSEGSVVTPTTFNNQWPDIPAGTEITEGQYVVLGTEGSWHKGGSSTSYIQSDFNETNNSSAGFIKNKPVKLSDFAIDIDYGDVGALRSDISQLITLPTINTGVDP